MSDIPEDVKRLAEIHSLGLPWTMRRVIEAALLADRETRGEPAEGWQLVPDALTDAEWQEVFYNVNRKTSGDTPDIAVWVLQEALKYIVFETRHRAPVYSVPVVAEPVRSYGWMVEWRSRDKTRFLIARSRVQYGEAEARKCAADWEAISLERNIARVDDRYEIVYFPIYAAPPADAERIRQLEADKLELVEGLTWYEENARLCRLVHSGGDVGRHALNNDGGKRAAALIEKHGGKDAE